MTALDMTDTIEPRSDQMNADDLMTGPRTFTITRVRKTGSTDQPVAVHLAEFPDDRPFLPSKSMRRVMVAAWGAEAGEYTDRRFTLFRDPDIKFGGVKVGGIRISHMSDLPGGKRLEIALTETRGSRKPYKVEPLAAAPPPVPAVSEATLAKLTDALRRSGIDEGMWLAGVNHHTGGAASALEVITEEQAQLVLGKLAERGNEQQPGGDV